jgi:hypothetical protein
MSMQIKNINGLSVQQLRDMVHQGGKFVIFPYTISIVLMTFKRSSDIYFVKPGEGSFKYGVGFFIINLLLGWWGIPWGPIYTFGSLFAHIGGGKNVTPEVLTLLAQNAPAAQDTNSYNIPGANANNGQGTQSYNIPGSNNNNAGSAYNVPR